jgi:hypothetical protein
MSHPLSLARQYHPVHRQQISLVLFPRNCCKQGWVLKNSFSRNRQKSLRVRMPYKQFAPVGYTFQVTDFDRTFTEEGLFQQPQAFTLTGLERADGPLL